MERLSGEALREFLEAKVTQFNRPGFILHDPVSIPHRFKKKPDIEIAGFIAAIFAWGNRVTVINKSLELLSMMDNMPHAFVRDHSVHEARRLKRFVHRTFNGEDVMYFLRFFQFHYQQHETLESAFPVHPDAPHVEEALIYFRDYFYLLDKVPDHVRDKISTPAKRSACKRINMFLRWMVRNDQMGVDFGLWKKIKPSQLVCPCDVHVERTARKLGLITHPQLGWSSALELTNNLKKFDPQDPVKYDFALFGLGVEERF